MSHTNIDTVLVEKMLQFKLPAAHSVRVPAGEAQGFSSLRPPKACCHIRPQKTVFRTARGRAAPVRREEMDVRSRPVSSTHACREDDRDQKISSSGELEHWFGTYMAGGSGFSGRGFDTRGCVLLRLPSSQLRGCCGFGLRLLRSGLLPGGGNFSLLGSFRDRLGRGMWNSGWRDSGLDNTPHSNDMIPPLAQVQLLDRRRGPLFFRCGKVGCEGAISATVESLLCKCGLRLFPIHSATVVGGVVSPAAAALGLFPRGTATTGEVGAPTRDAPGCVNAVSLRVQSACIALGLSGPCSIPPTLASRRVR